MQKMSGSDLALALASIGQLPGKRIAKIRKTEGGIFLFRIGPVELLFEPGVRLHLTRMPHQAAESPDGFVSLLRKNFEGKTVEAITQHGNDRIVELVVRSKERLVFELFRRGNLVFCSEDGTIVSCLHKDEAGGRKVARGEKYPYPKETAFVLKIPDAPSFSVLEDEMGFAVSYSLEGGHANALEKLKGFADANDMLDHYYSHARAKSAAQEAAEEKLTGLEKRREAQIKALGAILQAKKEAKEKGDAIYANFEELSAIVSQVAAMRKAGRGEEEISGWLSKKKARISGAEIEVEAGDGC